jgi:hypothetical protein
MTFSEAEKSYKDLQAQHLSGRLNDAAFEAEVGKLRLQDAQGRWWQIGVQTGEWYMHDGQKWNKAKPPATSQPAPAVEAAVVPEIVRAPAATPAQRVAAPKPAPTPKPEPAEKKESGSVLPARLFSPKPATRNGGLPPAAIIGIGIVALLVVIGLVLGVFWFLNQPKSNIAGLSGTATPTKGLFVPSPALPTLPPTPIPTETMVFPPTPVVTTTIPLIPTLAHTAVRAAPTATKKPAATAAPASSPTPNIPPGIYVTKLETDPPKISIGDPTGFTFKMTMFNNTGGVQVFKKWFVRIFSCPEQCSGDNAFKASFGESYKMTDVNIIAGTSTISTGTVPAFGAGRCDYTAIPYYVGDNEIAIPFNKTNGQPLYYSFKVCQ